MERWVLGLGVRVRGLIIVILLFEATSLEVEHCLDGDGAGLGVGVICLLIDLSNSELLTKAHGTVQSLETTNHEDVCDLYTNTIIVNFRIERVHVNVYDL